jgi:hypothetical protein
MKISSTNSDGNAEQTVDCLTSRVRKGFLRRSAGPLESGRNIPATGHYGLLLYRLWISIQARVPYLLHSRV